MSSRTKVLAAALALALLAGGCGYWSYSTREKRELRAAITAILPDVSARLREGLTLEISLPPVGRVGIGWQVEEQAAAVEQRLQQLKSLKSDPDPALYYATDAYVLTAREILLQQAASNRYRQSLTLSLDALRTHMQSQPEGRTDAWTAQALAAKERVDQDYRDYRGAAKAFDAVLMTLPGAQSRIASQIDAAQAVEQPLIGENHRRSLAAVAEAAAEIEKFTRLDTYR